MKPTPAPCRLLLAAILVPLCLAALLPTPSHAAPTQELIKSLQHPPRNPSIGTLVATGDGYYWGTSINGGAYNLGSVYKVKGDGSDWQLIASFSGTSGSTLGSLPFYGLVSDGAGNMWGTTYQGGAGDMGTVFKVNVSTGALTNLVDFTGTSGANKGANPVGRLTSDGAGNLWGSTTVGGANNKGTIFKINASTGVLTTVIEFTGTSGANKGDQPYAGLEKDGAGFFWGSTYMGGASNKGTLFKLEISTGTLTTLVELTGNAGANKGASPTGRMVSDGAGFYWGTCSQGGVSNFGTIYKLEASTGIMTPLIEFTNSAGAYGKTPFSELTSDGLGNFWGTTYQGGSLISRGTVYKVNMTTGALTTVLEFTDTDGASEGWFSYSGFVSDGAGSFIGTTYQGGLGYGNVYKVNISTGAYTRLTNFLENPFTINTGLASAADGMLWGTTFLGGAGAYGTVFKVNPKTGALTTVVEFSGSGATPGLFPNSTLTNDGAGNFWGTTNQGGANGAGTVFKVNATTGALTTVVDFTGDSGAYMGSAPAGQLFNDGAGFMWGTTASGGPSFNGTIFKVNISTGAFTNILNFAFNTPPVGSAPRAGLVSDGAGNLWGTTTSGGSSTWGTVFKIDMNTGVLTTLVEFTGTTGSYPGNYPAAGLASDGAGNMWGTTRSGGASNFGTVFKVNIATGAYTTVVEFTNSAGALGKSPYIGLTSDGAGNMWGATSDEISNNYGTVFKVNTTTNALTTVLQFTGPGFQGNGGPGPFNGYLLKGTDGNFYGTTGSTGPGGGGSIFRLRLGPTPATLAATSVSSSSATLNGTVNPNGTASTAAFDYGTAPNSLTSSTTNENFSAATTSSPVAHNVSGLSPNTTYYYRIRGENTDQLQPQVGEVMSFTTPANNNADLSNLVLSAGTLTPTFASATIDYTASVSNAITSITVTPTVAQAGATITVNGNAVTSGSASGAISLNPGTNNISIVVTAGDSVTTKTYTVVVTRLAPEIAVEQPAGTGLTDGSVTPVNFGNVAVGTGGPVDLIFTIKNTGDADLTGLTITKDGTDESLFTVTASPTAPVNGPSGSTTFTVRFLPTSTGVKTAALHIANNDPNEAPFDIAITGTGVAPVFGALGFQGAQVSVNEAATVINVPIARTGGSDGAVTVRVNSAIGSATLADYNVVNNVLVSFANGETTKTVPVTILNDAVVESNEAFTLTLSNPTGGSVLGSPVTATVLIVDTTSQNFTGDTIAPGVTVALPLNNSTHNVTSDTTLNINGAATDNKGVRKVQYSLNGGAYADAVLTSPGTPTTNWNAAITPLSGTNTLSVRSIDFATAAGSATVTASNTGSPTVSLLAVPTGLVVNTAFMGRTVVGISGTTVTLSDIANATTGFVRVTNSATTSPTVSVLSVPDGLAAGATLLGRTVTNVAGTTITLNGSASTAISSATFVTYLPVVTVNTSSISSATVTVASVPSNLAVGSTLLGRSVTTIAGTTITLSGFANAATAVPTARSFTSATSTAFTTTDRTSTVVTNTFKVLRNLQVNLAGTGTVSAGFAGTTFREAGKSFTIVATATVPATPTVANPGAVFTGWSVSNSFTPGLTQAQILAQMGVAANALEKSSLTFIFREGLVLTANFATSTFPGLAGTYNGLVHPDAALPNRPGSEADGTLPANDTEGAFNAVVDAKGGFSAKLTIDGGMFSFSGAFDTNGNARFGTSRALTQTVPRTNKPSLFVAFQVTDTNGLNVAGGEVISGTVTATDFKISVTTAVSNIVADKAYYGTQVLAGGITTSSATVNMVSTQGRSAGEAVTGTGIPANTTILALTPTQLTLSANATATNAAASLTFTRNVPAVYLGPANADGTFTVVFPAKAPHYEAQVTFNENDDTLDTGADNLFQTHSVIVLEGTVPAPLVAGQEYYLVNKSGSTFQLSTEVGGVPEDFSAPGTAVALLDPANRQVEGFAAQDYPQGSGTGTIKITKTGTVTLTGTLADGATVTASSTLSTSNQVPLFAQLYTLKGFLSALVKLDNTQADSDLKVADNTEVLWARPFILGHYYPYGWAEVIELDMLGAKYNATGSVLKGPGGAGLNPADLINGNASLTFYNGQLAETLVKRVSISTTNVVTLVPDPLDPTFTLSINATLGTISGKFNHTDDTKPTYQGIIYQKGPNAGAYGFFLTKQPAVIDYSGESGAVTLIGDGA